MVGIECPVNVVSRLAKVPDRFGWFVDPDMVAPYMAVSYCSKITTSTSKVSEMTDFLSEFLGN